MLKLALGIHDDIAEELYRSDPGLNQSLLKEFGRARSPAHFIDERTRPRKDTDSLRIGSFVDASIFGHGNVANRFAVFDGERRGSDWMKFRETHSGKVLLNGAENDRAHGCISAIWDHGDTANIIKVCRSQIAVVHIHPKLGLRMKALVDLLPDKLHCDPLLLRYAFDLKTADDASPEGFARACYDFGYDVQAAFYMDLLNLCGIPVTNFGFIVVENRSPHLIKIHYVTMESLIIRRAREKYEGWMVAYSQCKKEDHWPGYTSGWSELQFKPWMLRDESYAGEVLE